MSDPLWRPSAARIEATDIHRFMGEVRDRWGVEIPDYATLHRWSVTHRDQFWSTLWDHAGVIAQTKGETIVENGDRMPGARWFPQARLNFAENLLHRRDDAPAIIFKGEGQAPRVLSYAQLYALVARIAVALEAAGVAEGDRVAGFLPNLPEAIAAMLAVTSLGAVWSSCSPDFGDRGVVDRFGQIKPKVLFCADGYFYNGKRHDTVTRVPRLVEAIPSIERVVVVPYAEARPPLPAGVNATTLEGFIAPHAAGEIAFRRLPFDHPIYILYSSGTTGAPKCIVHGAGGTLLQHLKEHRLHTDIKAGERLFYFTTLGWMMWNWLVSGLASEATLVLYDGSPFHPGPEAMLDLIDETAINVFGTSAKFIDALKKAGMAPRRSHDLGSLRAILSTGSPLAPESFEYVYEQFKPDVCLSSIAGGTDLISCFALGCPALPVYGGELQCLGLGMKVEAWDDEGRSVIGEQGELVCCAPFPSMPVGFWNDPGDTRYHAAYFEKYPDVWCHGDYVEITEHGGMIIYGRSDAVLNPGGVRIGTAEIYRQVEQLDEVVEGLVIGQQWDNDTRVVLFVVLRDGLRLDADLLTRIRDQIRRNASPRHVPAKIIQVRDIPRTKSGKIVELAVRDVVHGRTIKNKEALANPEALEQFRGIAELAT